MCEVFHSKEKKHEMGEGKRDCCWCWGCCCWFFWGGTSFFAIKLSGVCVLLLFVLLSIVYAA